jgi:membrane complex biogenesis BtpA family protein
MKSLFKNPKVIIGMVHLKAMPGFPGYCGSLQEIVDLAVNDATALEKGGVDGLIIENIFNRPREKTVGPETVAPMTLILKEVVDAVKIPVGVKVLFNSFKEQIAMANVTGANFVRISVWVDTTVTVAGVIEGCAAEAIRYRKMIGAEQIKVLADVHIKHGAQLAYRPIEHAAADAVGSGLADGVVVTGQRTGQPTNIEDVAAVRSVVDGKLLLVGSGVTVDTVRRFLEDADGAIVGTYFKVDGILTNPVDEGRVRRLVERVRG